MDNGRFETDPVQAAAANAPQVSRLRSRGLIPVFLLFLLVPASLPVSAQESFLGDLTGPWQLLVDDYLIEERRGVVRTWHPLKKHPANPVLGMTGSWGERRTTPYGTVLPGEDGQGYRIWYDIWDGDCHNFYATSRDGLRWIRPRLGLVEHRGARDNNLFFHRTRLDHMPQIIHTPWEADPDRRYKMVNFDFRADVPGRAVRGYWGATSPDGVRWTETPRNPVLPDAGDVGHFLWDPNRRAYVGYTKLYAPVRGYRRRSVAISTPTRFQHWPPAELILVPDEFDDRWVTGSGQHTDFYGLAAFPYQSLYLGFLWIFRIVDGKNDGPIFCELVSSRDGVTWDRQEGERTPILANGPPGAWDSGQVQTFNHPQMAGETLRVYYGAFDATHGFQRGDGAIGLATLRKDGFVSLDAGSEGGAVTTRLLLGLEGELRLNANAGGGEIRVEVLDGEGRILPGYGRAECLPMTEDSVDFAVRWRGRDELPRYPRDGATRNRPSRRAIGNRPSPEPRRLRFLLTRASLFSFKAGDSVQVVDPPAPLEVFYTFDSSHGARFDDRAAADGIQPGRRHGSLSTVQDPEAGAGGSSTLLFPATGPGANRLEVPGTAHLGHEFTLAARVKTQKRDRMRLFSTQRGSGAAALGELIFDFSPGNGVLRLIVNGQEISSRAVSLAGGMYHHLAATYDRGRVRLYLDGRTAGSGRVLSGSARLGRDDTVVEMFGPPDARLLAGVHLAENLHLGADRGGTFVGHGWESVSSNRYQFTGWVDDVLVVKKVLDAEEIRDLSRQGVVTGLQQPEN